jgi:hypothetical protein
MVSFMLQYLCPLGKTADVHCIRSQVNATASLHAVAVRRRILLLSEIGE